jgi:hypothetical protein
VIVVVIIIITIIIIPIGQGLRPSLPQAHNQQSIDLLLWHTAFLVSPLFLVTSPHRWANSLVTCYPLLMSFILLWKPWLICFDDLPAKNLDFP